MNCFKYKWVNDKLVSSKCKRNFDLATEQALLNIYPEDKQKVIGFGGAFTESSAYNYSLLSTDKKQQVLELLFGKSGLKYNFCRICIGSCDFALNEYDYIEENDYELKTFSINRDKKYVLPFIKDALKFTNNDIYLFASPWSPPAFMKDNNSRINGGKLKKECYDLYADYMIKFLIAYKNEGVNISAITIQNEAKAVQTWESCVFDIDDEIEFAKIFKKHAEMQNVNVKLLCWDHNKERLYERATSIFNNSDNAVDGIAFHWYSGSHFEAVNLINRLYPEKSLWLTEFCITDFQNDKVGTKYQSEILNDLKFGTNGICEWNLILDKDGGPYHNRYDPCNAPLRLSKNNDVYTTEIYRQLFIFSHFIEKDAVVLESSSYDNDIEVVAVRNKKDITVIVNNKKSKLTNVNLRFCNDIFNVSIKAKGVSVFVLVD